MDYEIEISVRRVKIETKEEKIAWRASLRLLLELLEAHQQHDPLAEPEPQGDRPPQSLYIDSPGAG